MMRKTIVSILCIIFTLFPLFHSASEVAFLQNPDAIEDAIRSMLFIVVFDENSEVIGSGSGFIAFDSHTVVTNHHVIEDAAFIIGSDENDNIYEIDRIIAFDEEKDIAILSIEGDTSLTPLELAENTILKRGQPVLTIGSPEGLKNSVSSGIISAIYDPNDTPDIQFTAPISHGSSGGALFDDKGRVIGITSAIYEEGQNINFAVSIDHVVDLYKKFNPSYKSSVSLPIFTPRISLAPTQKPESLSRLRPPTTLSANVYTTFVALMWSRVEGAAEYSIYRSDAQYGTYKLIANTTGTEYMDSSILPNSLYYYKVSATNKFAEESEKSVYYWVFTREGLDSPTVKPTPKPTAKPTSNPTTKPTPTLSPSPISLIKPEEVAKYKSLKAGMNDPAVARLKERMYELGYFTNKTVNNRFTETTAEYVKEFQRINGLNVDGIASPEMQALFFSEHALPKPNPTAKPTSTPKPKPTPRLAAPKNLKATISADAVVTITWKEVQDAQSYKVYRLNKNGGYLELLGYQYNGTTNDNEYVDTKAVKGETYHYKVESINDTNVSKQSSYVKVVMPKQPYVEPKYPLQIDGYAYWDYYSDYISFNPQVKNISEKSTIDGFTLTYYFEDIYGEKIKSYGYGSYYMNVTYTKTVKPNGSSYAGYVKFPEFTGVRYVYVAVSKIHTTSGKTTSIPEYDWNYSYWTIE